MASLKELTVKRSAIKGSLTRFKTFITKIDSEKPNLVQLELRLNKLEQNWETFCEVQTSIEVMDDDNFEMHSLEREVFENEYFDAVEQAKRLLESGQSHNDIDNKSITSKASSNGKTSASNTKKSVVSSHKSACQALECDAKKVNNVKLPTVKLPEFDGNYSQWLYFKDTFKSIVHDNADIANVQKFHYLRLSLKGEAAEVIHSLEISAANYTSAWDLLVERYENKVLLVNNHVKALFSLPTVGKESYFALRQLLDGFIKHFRALEVLEQPVKHWDTLLIFIISEKLDSRTRRDWEGKNNKKLPTTDDLVLYLRDRCSLLEKLNPVDDNKKHFKSRSFLCNNENSNCCLCKENHLLFQCQRFLKMLPNKRYGLVKTHNLCTNCLKSNHKNTDCKGTNCKKCHKRHHTLLHFENVQGDTNNTSTSEEHTVQTVAGHVSVNASILLSTAMIKVQDKFGNYHMCRVLLDSGSQSNFITQSLANKLQTDQFNLNVAVSGINDSLSQIKHNTIIKIMSNINSFECTINCLIIPRITGNLPLSTFTKTNLKIPDNVVLADPNFNESNDIDMLLGASIFWSLLRPGQIKLGKTKPILQKTVFGWVMAGEIPQSCVNYMQTQCYFISTTDINNNLSKFWDIEEYANAKPVSPDDEAIESFFRSTTQPNTILNVGENNETHTLGLLWHSQSDILSYSIRDLDHNKLINKRNILSLISQIYDPLGLLGPVIVLAKTFLQKLWQRNCTWDEELPPDIRDEWEAFSNQLRDLRNIQVPRHVICDNPYDIQLHGFADASKTSYGACIYIRSVDNHNTCQVRLLCAKSRVAPLKCVTIPRLELCAALLLARLIRKVQISLKLSFNNICMWSDSTIVLAWIKSKSNNWKVFVANRIYEIQKLTNEGDWRYVNTETNPADIISRGTTPRSLQFSNLWWLGPEWLSSPPETWPTDISSSSYPPECDVEAKPTPKITLNLAETKTETLNLFEKYSSLVKLQRVLAYVIRFRNNTLLSRKRYSNSEQRGPLTSNELQDSLDILTQMVQREAFASEFKDLSKPCSVNIKGPLLKLNPYIDKKKIIRVGGRLNKSSFDINKKHPIVLPSNHPFSMLLVKNEHTRLLHAGPQQVLASLRERFWILSARNLVKKVIHNCITCYKIKPVTTKYLMGDLPGVRISPSRPFINCGIDYCGPFNLRDRKTRKFNVTKAYVCLFVCLSTKAVHLELTSDLSTASFLAALNRFVSRRGLCANIYSDNATNFVGANAELQKFLKSIECELVTNLSQRGISWHFIPPRAPHFGGVWEGGVKSCKYHIKRIIGESNITFEEFNTILTQIEACLNSRPLYPMSSDPNDPNPLTPAHFLIGEPLTSVPTANLLNVHESALSRYKRGQKMVQAFWARWSKEYIAELQIRRKWKTSSNELLKPDVLVIIKEDHLPPCKWALGRILQLHPGADGITRVVTVKTHSGVYKRPVSKICVLPSDSD